MRLVARRFKDLGPFFDCSNHLPEGNLLFAEQNLRQLAIPSDSSEVSMTTKVRHLLESFDALPASEQHQAIVEILRRAPAVGDIPETTLVEAADGLFDVMDKGENAIP
jgi:hypothetical protein